MGGKEAVDSGFGCSGMSCCIDVENRQAARQILSDTKTFIKGESYTNIFSLAFGDGLVTSLTDKHKKDRSMLGGFFIKSSLDNYVGMMNEQTVKMMGEAIEPNVDKSLDMQRFYHYLALRVFTKFALNFDSSSNSQEEDYIVEKMSWGSWAVGFLIYTNLPIWNIFSVVRRLRLLVAKCHEIFLRIYDERVQATENPVNGTPPDDLLQTLVQAKLPRKEIADHLMTLVGAGHDTTAFFGCYMTYLLAENPDCQVRLREELDLVMGDRTLVTPEDIVSLRYMRKVMQETLRLYAVIPQLQRKCMEDTKLKESGIVIPKNTTILIPLFVMNRDPEVWENPNSFNPDRFDGIEHNSAKHGYLPFGYGSRTCIGNSLAIMEATVIFANLLRRYSFEKDPLFKPRIASGISMTSDNGVQVIIRRLHV